MPEQPSVGMIAMYSIWNSGTLGRSREAWGMGIISGRRTSQAEGLMSTGGEAARAPGISWAGGTGGRPARRRPSAEPGGSGASRLHWRRTRWSGSDRGSARSLSLLVRRLVAASRRSLTQVLPEPG